MNAPNSRNVARSMGTFSPDAVRYLGPPAKAKMAEDEAEADGTQPPATEPAKNESSDD